MHKIQKKYNSLKNTKISNFKDLLYTKTHQETKTTNQTNSVEK